MDSSLVRVCGIKLTGFKNINNGAVTMPSVLNHAHFLRKADVLGIYGQNGSGKTAVIEAMDFIRRLLMGSSLPDDAVEYIGKDYTHFFGTAKNLNQKELCCALTMLKKTDISPRNSVIGR